MLNSVLRLLKLSSLMVLSSLLAACTTPRQKGFEKIQVGMDKSSVLEIAGNPDKTQRWNGKDRWTYKHLISDTNAEIKEVHFEEGRVVYVGSQVHPAISAEEQDRRNAAQNQIDEQAKFDVPGSTYIQVIKPNWEGINSGEAPPEASQEPAAEALPPKFERIQ